jgi:DNA-binding GntR family transcriptional regulator
VRDMSVLKSLQIKPLRERAADAVRDAIVAGELAPGDRIPEGDLATQLGVSRAPIREAIRILEQQGLVVVHPKSGTFVSRLTLEQVYDGQCVRAALEELAVRQALQRLDIAQWQALCNHLAGVSEQMQELVVDDAPDPATKRREAELDIEWHAVIVQATLNQTLIQTWRNVAWLTRIMMRNVVGSPSSEEWAQTVESHEALLAVLRRRNPEECVAATHTHVLARASRLLGRPLI